MTPACRRSVARSLLSLASLAAAQSTAPYRGPTTTNTYTPLPTEAVLMPVPVGVTAIPAGLRKEFDVPPFYTRGLVVRGIPILGSDKPSDYAFLEAAYVLDHLLADCPAWVRDALTRRKVKLGILAVVEYTMDVPENQTPQNLKPREAAFQDRRSRGLGGLPLATCGEENLLNLRGDPYRAEDITIHEFAHTLLSAAGEADPAFLRRVKTAYDDAMKAGRFAHSYSATNVHEYWAEGVQAWFDCAAPTKDAGVHSGIWHRDQLKAYDPALAAVIAEAYGDGPWRYVRTDGRPLTVDGRTRYRPADESAHLAGLDRSALPAFDFGHSPRIWAWAARSRPATTRAD